MIGFGVDGFQAVDPRVRSSVERSGTEGSDLLWAAGVACGSEIEASASLQMSSEHGSTSRQRAPVFATEIGPREMARQPLESVVQELRVGLTPATCCRVPSGNAQRIGLFLTRTIRGVGRSLRRPGREIKRNPSSPHPHPRPPPRLICGKLPVEDLAIQFPPSRAAEKSCMRLE